MSTSGVEYHCLTATEVLTSLKVDPAVGLTDARVKELRRIYGENGMCVSWLARLQAAAGGAPAAHPSSARLTFATLSNAICIELKEQEGTPMWRLILEQFKDQLVQILLAAAVVSFILAALEEEGSARFAAFVEPLVIVLILIANATVGVVQEVNAEKAISALKSYAPDVVRAVRNGGIEERIRATALVPGDVVELAVGDKVPADLYIIAVHSAVLRVDQALLTGESCSVQKGDPLAVVGKDAVLQEQANLLFSGTTVVAGRARGVVIRIGEATILGGIHASISTTESERTPLKRRLDEFGDLLARVISVICILVWVINFRHFGDPVHGGFLKGAVYYFKIAVALAVAAIPEGLSVIITTCLALGTKKMARNNAIVRTLPSVETLGCTSVICSDKTGTLTTNRMCASRIFTVSSAAGDISQYAVEGRDYTPRGRILALGTQVDGAQANGKQPGPAAAAARLIAGSPLCAIREICALCNDARVIYDVSEGAFVNVGEPTEAALRVLVEKLGSDDAAFSCTLSDLDKVERASAVSSHIEAQFAKVATLDLDRERKSMSVIVRRAKRGGAGGEGPYAILVKGAPESIIERCTHVQLEADSSIVPLTDAIRASIVSAFEAYARREALRILAFAKVEGIVDLEGYNLKDESTYAAIESNMVLVGLVGLTDPPREEVATSLRQCSEAGIRVIVVTGDNQSTAEAICRQVGLLSDENGKEEHGTALGSLSMTGRQFALLSEHEKRLALETVRVISRTEPAHKFQIVQALQQAGHIVAMTGDGVNDAPALKRADIGIAMGSGTDVAKLASDMVLADDNFATIVSAIQEGRSIYNNTKQFIRYLISSNIGEVVSIFLTVLLGMPEALIPVQLLWVNLVTDGLPATALGFNPADSRIMREAPRNAREPIVGQWLLARYCIIGAYVGGATVGGYAWWFTSATRGPHIALSALMNYTKCATAHPAIDCLMFSDRRAQTATTMSLSILVTVEMFNAMNRYGCIQAPCPAT